MFNIGTGSPAPLPEEIFLPFGDLEYGSSGSDPPDPIPLGPLPPALTVPDDNDRDAAEQQQVN